MRKFLTALTIGIFALFSILGAAFADPVKVGFVYLTNPGDHGAPTSYKTFR